MRAWAASAAWRHGKAGWLNLACSQRDPTPALAPLPLSALQACEYSSVSYCPSYQPGPSAPVPGTNGSWDAPYPSYPFEDDPSEERCAYSQDPCCSRATSYAICTLDSPPEDSCSFYGSCSSDYGLCYRQVGAGGVGRSGRLAEQAGQAGLAGLAGLAGGSAVITQVSTSG